MPRAYSEDLRARVLSAVDGGMPAYTAAKVFRVSVSYIYKALIRRRTTGETAARARHGTVPAKLAGHDAALRQRVAAEADMTLGELQAWAAAELGVVVSLATLWTRLERLGLSLKKRASMRSSRIGWTSPVPAPLGASANRP